MMKKKSNNQEEAKENNEYETSDNKEHTHSYEHNVTKESEESASGEPEESVRNGINDGDVASDKVVTEEMQAEEKLAEMKDKYIRLSAEFDNYRKRTLREKMDISKYAGENLLLKIIPLMDDFDRALKHMDSAKDCTSMKDGIDLIYNKFSEFLKQSGITEIESLNCNFNVDLHEAVAKVPVDDEDKKGKIVDVIQKGYYIQDKVLRFSKVVIGE
jgi:molecular chaperone GrpE